MKLASGHIDLTASDTALAALPLLAQADIAKLKTQIALFLHSNDPEVTHQLRVALRRLRTLLWAYQPLLPDGSLGKQWRRTLGEVAGGVDAVRDWDILVDDLLPASMLADTEGNAELQQALNRARRSARIDCRQWLVRSGQTALADILATAFDEAACRCQANDVCLEQFAQGRVDAAAQRLDALMADCRTCTLAELHRVRIQIKRLRYLLEYFSEVAMPPAHKRIYQLKCLQDALGALNDVVVAGRRIAEMSPARELAPMLIGLQHWLANQEGLRRRQAMCELSQWKSGA